MEETQRQGVVTGGDLLTEVEAARLLACSQKTMQGWRWRGGGPRFRRLGVGRGVIRYSRADLDAYIAAAARTSTSDTGEVRS